MKTETARRITNWGDYNKSLISRGSIHLWISPDVVSQWTYQGKRKPGGVKQFSDLAIQACLLVKEVYRLSFRQCEGLLRSLKTLLNINKVPSYTTLCRRMSQIRFNLSSQLTHRKALHVLIDSTGLKLLGENEWYKKKHHLRSYSLWSKLHLAVDHGSQKIISVQRSNSHAFDSKYVAPLLKGLDLDIACIYGDGAYDKRLCYHIAYEHQAHLLAPVQRYARKQKDNRNYPNDLSLIDRDRKIDFIREFEDETMARTLWKKVSGYHKRSLVETAIYRFKQAFGNDLSCKTEHHQQKQMEARAFALNRMNDTGMPLYSKA